MSIEIQGYSIEYTNDETRTPHILSSFVRDLDGATIACGMWGHKGNKYTVYQRFDRITKNGTTHLVREYAHGIHTTNGIEWKVKGA